MALDEALFLHVRAQEITADTRRTVHRQQKARNQEAARATGHQRQKVR